MADLNAGVIGAAHAGWRGAFNGIVESTLDQMTELGASKNRITAAVGPCIAQESYEVGGEFWDRFHAETTDNDRFFISANKDGHFMFDLPAYVAAKLSKAGINNVIRSDLDTCSDREQFFSYRRTVLRGEKQYGRCLSVIVLL